MQEKESCPFWYGAVRYSELSPGSSCFTYWTSILSTLLCSLSQFIIAEDGSCGLVYEHAPSEGPPIVALLDHIVEYT